MHSQQPPRQWGENNQPPWPDAPYGQQPAGPYQQPGWEPPPGGPYPPQTSGPPPQQPPRKRRRGLKVTLLIVIAIAVLIIVATALGGGSKNGTGTAASAPPSTAPAAPTTSSPAAQNTGPVGTTYRITDENNDVYDVTLTKILAHAAPDNSFDAAPNGKHLAGLKFTIKGVSGNATDDVNNDAVIVGSDGQLYQASFESLAAGTDFSSGTWSVSPGTTEKGWAAFEIPDDVRIASIQWQPDSGMTGQHATWTK